MFLVTKSFNLLILELSILTISLISSPCFFFLSFYFRFSRYLFITLFASVFYLYISNKINLQLKLLIFFKGKYFVTYFNIVSCVLFSPTFFNLFFSSFLFFSFGYLSFQYKIFYILYQLLKVYNFFVFIPTFLYNSLYKNETLIDSLINIENKYENKNETVELVYYEFY